MGSLVCGNNLLYTYFVKINLKNMEREFIPNKELNLHTTLSELQKLLRNSPDVFGNQLQVTQEAVEDAATEIKERRQLSQGTAERLDDLYRPFKPDSLK